MAESTIWWLITGVLVAAELMTGTFYLLMLAIGMACAALAAHVGLTMTYQMVCAAIVGFGAVGLWHMLQMRKGKPLDAQADPNVNLDIGGTVDVGQWQADGTAKVQYRGAQWTAVHRPGILPSTGAHRVSELVGSRLLVDKA